MKNVMNDVIVKMAASEDEAEADFMELYGQKTTHVTSKSQL